MAGHWRRTARAVFKSWFVDFDPVLARATGEKPPGLKKEIAALFPDTFEESEVGEIPKGWRRLALPEAVSVNPPRLLSKGMPAPYLDMASMPTEGPSPEFWVTREFGSGMKFINGDLGCPITPVLENGKTAYVDFWPMERLDGINRIHGVPAQRGNPAGLCLLNGPYRSFALSRFSRRLDQASPTRAGKPS